jgi:hypothetical protein
MSRWTASPFKSTRGRTVHCFRSVQLDCVPSTTGTHVNAVPDNASNCKPADVVLCILLARILSQSFVVTGIKHPEACRIMCGPQNSLYILSGICGSGLLGTGLIIDLAKKNDHQRMLPPTLPNGFSMCKFLLWGWGGIHFLMLLNS